MTKSSKIATSLPLSLNKRTRVAELSKPGGNRLKNMRISNHIAAFAAACCWLVGAAVVQASPGLICSTVDIVECSIDADCETQSTLSNDSPLFVRLDLANKKVETVWEEDRRQSTEIATMVRNGGLVLLQGVEPARQGERSAIGWTLSLDETTGHMVITASGRDTGYTIFGACTSVE